MIPAGQQIPQDDASLANGHASAHELFALTDEQILEIEPENANAGPRSSEAHSPIVIPSERSESRDRGNLVESSSYQDARHDSSTPSRSSTGTAVGMTEGKTPTGSPEAEPPPWLAAQMKDPGSGEEARELWNGVQQARQEAAAYRAAFATPEDARALKELYPGGVNEARAAAERARALDDIDRAYFGAAGKSAQEVSASRAQLAQQMLREDPAAFREMVFAGLRALEESGKVPGDETVAQTFRPEVVSSAVGRATLASPGNLGAGAAGAGFTPHPAAPSVAGAPATAGAPAGDASAREAHVAAYAAFEKAANDDLERSVGASIERTLQQALPNIRNVPEAATAGARSIVPLHERLNGAIRQDVEAALKGDRQLSEQVAQILSGRRLDNETRAQVVRLIGERAQQLVPVAAKRVLSDWTQTTLAAHRGNAARGDAASTRREVAPASLPAGPTAGPNRAHSKEPNRSALRSDSRRVDYGKLSDDQILDL